MRATCIGVDLAAQGRDYLGLAVVTVWRDASGHFSGRVESVGRRRNVVYDKQDSGLYEAALSLDAQALPGVLCGVTLDTTGNGGGPIVDRLFNRLEAEQSRVQVRGIWLHSGETERRSAARTWQVNVPREDALEQTLAALRTDSLDIAGLPSWFGEELLDLVRRVKTAGGTRVEHRRGKHDDAVWAVVLGYWGARRLLGSVGTLHPPRTDRRVVREYAPRGMTGTTAAMHSEYRHMEHVVRAREKAAAVQPAGDPRYPKVWKDLPPELQNRGRWLR